MTKKRAIVAFHQNKYDSFLNIVLDRFKTYCKKCNAELIEIKIDDDVQYPMLSKFFTISQLKNFERYLILDVDILIRKDAPDIFEIVPKEKMAMFNESAAFHSFLGTNTDQIAHRFNAINLIIQHCGLEKIVFDSVYHSWEKPFNYYNYGVVIYPENLLYLNEDLTEKQKINIFDYNKKSVPQDTKGLLDQTLINYLLKKNNINVYSLPTCFNQMIFNYSCDYLQTSYFLHYAGYPFEEKVEKILKYDSEWKKIGF